MATRWSHYNTCQMLASSQVWRKGTRGNHLNWKCLIKLNHPSVVVKLLFLTFSYMLVYTRLCLCMCLCTSSSCHIPVMYICQHSCYQIGLFQELLFPLCSCCIWSITQPNWCEQETCDLAFYVWFTFKGCNYQSYTLIMLAFSSTDKMANKPQ